MGTSQTNIRTQYPWAAVEFYTIKERNSIFDTCIKQIHTLADFIHRGNTGPPLGTELLDELLNTALKAPAFSEKQRARLIQASSNYVQVRTYITPTANEWPFEALGRAAGAAEDMIQVGSSSHIARMFC